MLDRGDFLKIRVAVFLMFAALNLYPQAPEPNGAGVQPGTLPLSWTTGGPKCMEVPGWQVHEYNRDLYIIRQSGCTNYEKPFLYLIFGKDRALLLDTGAENGNVSPMIEATVTKWLGRVGRAQIPLIVAHSHSHSDHTAGDAELKALRNPAIPITFLPAEVEATRKFYAIQNWPEDIGHVDLGGRVLDVIPIPGHDIASVALYDRQTAILFTGDSLYPGRLYVRDFPAFAESTHRLVQFTGGKIVAQILGCHIEQSRTPYLDYPVGTMYQPQEHDLALSRGALLELDQSLAALKGKPARVALRDFTIWPAGTKSTASEKAAFEATQKEQRAHMWNQPER